MKQEFISCARSEKVKTNNNNNSSVLLEIKSHYTQMNEAMQRIADYIVSSDQYDVYITAGELANQSNVSTASVSRFVRLLGCRDFDEFRFKMLMEQKRQQEQKFTEDGMLSYNGEAISGTAHDICKVIFSKSIHEIEETWNMVDVSQVEKIANLLDKARRIVVIAVGRSKLTAEALFSRLYRIGYPIFIFSDSHEIVNITSIMEEDDVLIAISNFGKSKSIVEGVRRAKKRNVHTVGITSVKGSPLSLSAEDLLYSAYDYSADNSGKLYDPSSENAAQLVLIDCLYMLVARENEKRNVAYFKTFSKEIESEHINK